MHRRASLVIATAAVLAVAAPAGAKQVTGASVCGANGCVDRTAVLGPQRPDAGLLDLGSVRVAEPKAGAFVRVKIHIGAGGKTFHVAPLIFLSGQGLAAAEDGSWWKLPPRTLHDLRRLTRGVAPLPARQLRLPVSTATHARVVETFEPAATRNAAAHDDGGALSPIVPAGIAALLLGAGGAILVTRRRRHATDALGETPATT